MAGIIISSVAYLVASYYIKRYLDSIDAPRGLTRSALIFTIALFFSYVVWALIDWLF